jgi:2-(1,2-epoxy-1,2-dihydrophenyl)acetyl-CoA isomerase
MADTNSVLFETQDNLGILTFNRPQRLNALTEEIISESLDLVEQVSSERSVRALMITGAGRGFCSGADLGTDQALEDTAGELGEAMRNGINKLVLAICNAPFPVVTAVNGAAAGAGVGIALAGDFLIASESMRLLLTFSRIGMGLDAGNSWFLSQLLGTKRAVAVSMLVEPIDAKRALEWGIAYSIASDAKLVAEATEFATRLSNGPTKAFAAQKRQYQLAQNMTLQETLDMEATVQDELVASNDLNEGIAAFREKRPAKYTGT